MGKKYTPSGYQIINITVDSEDNYFVEESEDKQLLLAILHNTENFLSKPILLQIDNLADGDKVQGFAIFNTGVLKISGDYLYAISSTGTDLEIQVTSI